MHIKLVDSPLKVKITESLCKIFISEMIPYCDREFSFEGLIVITIDSSKTLTYNLSEKFIASTSNKVVSLQCHLFSQLYKLRIILSFKYYYLIYYNK